MGMYLNPSAANFTQIINSKIYIDKSMMIAKLNGRINDSGRSFLCVSRARRFGKTITTNMISTYYGKWGDAHEIFDRFKIAGDSNYGQYMNRFNVIKIDLNGEYAACMHPENFFDILNKDIVKEMQVQFPNVGIADEDSIAKAIQKVYETAGEQFIILIDEYDVFVRDDSIPQSMFGEYLKFLISLFKNDALRPALALSYLTGILPIIKDKIQSKLNTFHPITMLDAEEFAEFVGFTTEEVESLCRQYGIDFAECRRWYDGYNQGGIEFFNPQAVVNACLNHKFKSYWSATSSFEAISDKLKYNFDGVKEAVIRMLSGENVKVKTDKYTNTMTDFKSCDDVLTHLIHLGYLAYDEDERTCRIPNMEIRKEWFNAIDNDAEYAETNKVIEDSKELLEATLKGDEDAVAKALDRSHIHVCSNRSYNNEDALQSAIYLAYIYAINKYTIIREMTTGKGFADVVLLPAFPNMAAVIIELKHNKSAETALTQIKNKQYFASLEHFHGEVLFVGVNYDEQSKTHECRMEWFNKE
ncbi:MAG: AAA family ATPase [Spirochaetales bacterium]|nr:AAA family ATPase [Spirochaetales bacterium]